MVSSAWWMSYNIYEYEIKTVRENKILHMYTAITTSYIVGTFII